MMAGADPVALGMLLVDVTFFIVEAKGKPVSSFIRSYRGRLKCGLTCGLTCEADSVEDEVRLSSGIKDSMK